ncbi:acyl-CoA thioester hydrolase YciA [Motiliproteus sp. SC1-56]|uniref:acyl-CoA thioester hydrolase YciA n=1 Tax=Motiliproteus sp. SC1-56 TaxID=2799565 RepID=UPI001A8FECD7|nr:acyl-CoA thioester hydrolase YciA [Motiliproteus sp. SC1-56]
MNTSEHEPQGSLLLRTMAMPADTNPNGDIFGGWIMSQMDIAGGILAKEIAGGRVVTVAVEGMKFIKPVKVGDVVCCYGELRRVGKTSLALQLEVWVNPILRSNQSHRFKVTEAAFFYVAIDDTGAKRVISPP